MPFLFDQCPPIAPPYFFSRYLLTNITTHKLKTALRELALF